MRRRWALVLSLALVVAMATGVAAGLGSMERWRLESNDASFAQLHMHDLRVTLSGTGFTRAGTLTAAANAIDHPERIAATQERLIIPTQVDATWSGGSILVPGKLVGVPVTGAESRIDSRAVRSGRDLGPGDSGRPTAVVEANFADYHQLPVPLDVRLAGGHRVRLVGTALQPEQFLVTRPGADFGAEAGYIVLYASRATVQGLSGHPGDVNELVLELLPDTDPRDIAAELKRSLDARVPGLGVTFTTKEEEAVHRVLYEDAHGDQRMISVFAWLLLAGAALASFNLVSRVVEAQRREIGVGMALGVPSLRLAIRPLLFAAEISLIGVVAGIGVGVGVNEVYRRVLTDLLSLPVWRTPFNVDVYLRAAALGFAIPFLAAVVPVVRAVRVPPIAAIRVGELSARGVGLAPLLERLHLPGSSSSKMPLRNLLRTPRRTLMSVLGIAAVITILVALAGLFDSFDRALSVSRDDALRGNPTRMTATLSSVQPLDGAAVRAIVSSPAVAQAVPTLVLPVTLASRRDSFAARVELLDPNNPVWAPQIVTGSFTNSQSGIVLAHQAAADLGLGVGDIVSVTHPVRSGPTSFRTVTSTLPITGLHANPLRGNAYMPPARASLFDLTGAANTVEIRPRLTTGELTRAVLAVEGVAFVESAAAIPDAVETYLDDFLAILRITQVLTLVLAVLIAVNTTTISTEERRRENATLLAFGTSPGSVLRNTILESAVIGALGTLVGIGLGVAVLGWIINVVSRDTYPELGIPVSLGAGSLVVTATVGIVAVGLAPVLGARSLRRMDIPATLRVVE